MKLIAEYLPDIARFAAMLIAAAAADLMLHAAGLGFLGLYAGVLGTFLILVSFLYSARKRKLISWGSPRVLLSFHKAAAWVGPLLILVHGGFHFAAVLPWLASLLMVIVVASGLTGSHLFMRARADLARLRKELVAAGNSAEETDRSLHQRALAVDAMKKWRVVHLPLTSAFAVLAVLHVVTVLVFRSG